MFARNNLKIASKEATDAQLVTLTDVSSAISVRESSERNKVLLKIKHNNAEYFLILCIKYLYLCS